MAILDLQGMEESLDRRTAGGGGGGCGCSGCSWDWCGGGGDISSLSLLLC